MTPYLYLSGINWERNWLHGNFTQLTCPLAVRQLGLCVKRHNWHVSNLHFFQIPSVLLKLHTLHVYVVRLKKSFYLKFQRCKIVQQFNPFTLGVKHMWHPEKWTLPGVPPVWRWIRACSPILSQAAASTQADTGPAPQAVFETDFRLQNMLLLMG